jgi:hypothetical protein
LDNTAADTRQSVGESLIDLHLGYRARLHRPVSGLLPSVAPLHRPGWSADRDPMIFARIVADSVKCGPRDAVTRSWLGPDDGQ